MTVCKMGMEYPPEMNVESQMSASVMVVGFLQARVHPHFRSFCSLPNMVQGLYSEQGGKQEVASAFTKLQCDDR